MGVFIGASTKIVDRETGEIFVGEVPEYAVVVPGTLPAKPLKNGQPGPATACAVIVRDGLTPRLAETAEPSTTEIPGWPQSRW